MKIRMILLMGMLGLLLACGSRPVIEPVAQEALKPVVAGKEGWEAEWEKTLQAARKEGRVVVGALSGPQREVMGSAFMKRYPDIEVDYIIARGVLLAQKVGTERRNGLYLFDVYSGGSGSAMGYFAPQGWYDPLEPALILPEVKEPHNWLGGKHLWIDRERTLLGFSQGVSDDLAINTALVNPKELTSYRELLKSKYEGKIVMGDPTIPGSNLNWFFGVSSAMGIEFMRELAKQKPVLTRDDRFQIEGLARGKFLIAISAHEFQIKAFAEAGAPVMAIKMNEGARIATAAGNVALFNRAPHPNAARVYINWLLSKEGQRAFIKMGYPTSRADVSMEGFIEPIKIPDPNVKYINMSNEEMRLKAEEFLPLAEEIFGPLKK